jgi:DNA-binding GntR family transcriptional regulator
MIEVLSMSSSAGVGPILRDSLADQVYALLWQRIEKGILSPGARLVEEELSRELGISKTPLRMALHRLQQDGVVRILPRRGIYVTDLTPEEILEVIDLREALEGLAVRRAAERATAEFVKELRACFQGFRPEELESRKRAYAAADHQFHILLVRASGNRQLIRMMDLLNIRIQMYRLRTVALNRRNAVLVHREHLEIIEAVDHRDGERAECQIRAHIRNVRQNVEMELLGA